MSLRSLVARVMPERVKRLYRGRLFGYRPARIDLGAVIQGGQARVEGIELALVPEVESDVRYHFFENGSAAEEMHSLIREARETGGLLVDVGSHHGLMAVVFCLAHPSNRAVAIEPSSRLAEVASRFADANGVGDRISLRSELVGAHEGAVDSWLDEHAFIRVDAPPEGTLTRRTRVSRIDEICAGLEPSVIKIDVEGAELEVLRGAAATLRRHRPVLLIELHLDVLAARGEDPREITRILHALGYRWETSLGGRLPAWRVDRSPAAILRVVARPGRAAR